MFCSCIWQINYEESYFQPLIIYETSLFLSRKDNEVWLPNKGRYCYFYLTIATIYVKIFSLHHRVIT